MKLAKINPEFKRIIKAVSLISWSLLIFMANAQNWLIEFYLISIALGIVCYFSFKNKASSKTGDMLQRGENVNKGPQREKYLNVFFFDPA